MYRVSILFLFIYLFIYLYTVKNSSGTINSKKCLKILKSKILILYTNTSGSLGEREMLWEREPQTSVSTAFSSSPKLSRVFV